MTPKELEKHLSDNYMTIAQFAKASGYTRYYIYQLLAAGLVQGITPFKGSMLIEKKYLEVMKNGGHLTKNS